LAAAINKEAGIDAELIRGGKGIFDVVVDGDLIFSKYEKGRFPEDDEVTSVLRERAPATTA